MGPLQAFTTFPSNKDKNHLNAKAQRLTQGERKEILEKPLDTLGCTHFTYLKLYTLEPHPNCITLREQQTKASKITWSKVPSCQWQNIRLRADKPGSRQGCLSSASAIYQLWLWLLIVLSVKTMLTMVLFSQDYWGDSMRLTHRKHLAHCPRNRKGSAIVAIS